MRVIKRNGNEVNFDLTKIVQAIYNANDSVDESVRLTDNQIMKISTEVVNKCSELGRPVYVEEIQDMVEMGIMEEKAYYVAKHYITYRFKHSVLRTNSTTNKALLNIDRNPYQDLINSLDNKSYGEFVNREVLKGIAIEMMFDSKIIDETNKGAFFINNIDKIALRMIDTSLVDFNNITINENYSSFADMLINYKRIIESIRNNEASKPFVLLESLANYLKDDDFESLVSHLKFFFIDTCNEAIFVFNYANVKQSKKKIAVKLLLHILKLKKDINFSLIIIDNDIISNIYNEDLFKDLIIFSSDLYNSIVDENNRVINKASVTLNMFDIAMKSNDINEFKDNLKSTILVVKDALNTCDDRFKSSFASSNRYLFMDGGFSELKSTDKLIKAFKNGNAKFTYAYTGLKEASKKMNLSPDDLVNALFDGLKDVYKSKVNYFVTDFTSDYISSYLMKKSQLCYGIMKNLTDHDNLENVKVNREADKTFIYIDNKNITLL